MADLSAAAPGSAGVAGRERRRAGSHRRGRAIEQMPWRQLVNPYPPARIVSDDELNAIHLASLDLLENVGVRIFSAEALDVFARAGAAVDHADHRVRLGRDIVTAALKTCISSFQLTPRNPARAVTIGGNNLAFATVLGPPYCTDIERGRRNGNLADYADFIRLAHYFNIIHLIGSPVEAVEIPVPVRHLDMALANLLHTDKVPYVFCQSRERIRDVLTMYATARGETLEEFSKRPGTYSIINTNSPLQFDTPMAVGIMDMARFGQPVIITPFTLSGATTPATLASGALLANTEALFGITLGQLVRPGAPVIYGAHIKNIDLKTGAPAYGLPESFKGNQLAGQMARFYGLPYRSSNFNASNAVDAAAAYESQGTTFAAISGGVNLLMHAAGWLEGGLCASFDKFVIDVEMLQGMACYLDPVRIDAETLAVDEITQVGPGGHFFGTPRTIATYENAFYSPLVSITQNYGAWKEAGAPDATTRAHRLYKQALAEYEQPVIDPAIRESLEVFVARRKEEGGSPLN